MFANFRHFNVILLLLTLPFLIKCSKQNKDTYGEIVSVLNAQASSWNRGDISSFMEGYENSDSLQFITKKGKTMGWNNLKSRYEKAYPGKKEMGTLKFDKLNVKSLSSDLAQVYGNWQLKTDSVFGGSFSLILKRTDEGWKIIIDHTW
ncbi:MAG: nuclear transport factor 2 family protein [Flavobacteriales bacterium]|nr:nuclear transport factor 2 family protein [Flavobacteriales bacterium]